MIDATRNTQNPNNGASQAAANAQEKAALVGSILHHYNRMDKPERQAITQLVTIFTLDLEGIDWPEADKLSLRDQLLISWYRSIPLAMRPTVATELQWLGIALTDLQ